MREPYIGRPLTRVAHAGRGPLVDCASAREHVQRLLGLGMGWGMIARAAGVSDQSVRLLVDEWSTCQQAFRDAVLSVSTRPHRQQALVLNVGCRRRLQALSAKGWTGVEIARRLGWSHHKFITEVRAARAVRWATHIAVADLYERISHIDGGSERAKAHAARAGWSHPGLWDDIDDINEMPHEPQDSGLPDGVVVDRVLSGQWCGPVPRAERQVAFERMQQQGMTAAAIADRLNVDPRTVERHRAGLRLSA